MSLELVLASTNKGKIEEIKALMKGMPITLKTQTELHVPDIEETGTTFIENAIIKARQAAKITKLPALADDSGLTVEVLGDAPGVYSARYAGPKATDEDRINKLLKELDDVPDEERSAQFHCVIALLEHPADPAPLICHGIWDGVIIHGQRGDKGFGYDPVFYVPEYECTAAELDPKVKNEISHRGQALAQLKEILKGAL